MTTPVALFAFNRPETTARVFGAIREARPRNLFLICDGPRPESPHECDAVRSILEGVDWPCDVRTNFAAENMGCGPRMISGISWVFSQAPEAIILEDDCLPSPSFFQFASEMLTRYRNDSRVMMVAGGNGVFHKIDYKYSYTFGHSVGVWGWATWASAWERYDESITEWPGLRQTRWLSEILKDKRQVSFWREMFDRVYAGEGTWDWQWVFSIWVNDGLSIIPSRNLVKNIGFGPGATSGATEEIPWLKEIVSIPLCEMDFPLTHPRRIKPDRKVDTVMFEKAFAPQLPSQPESRATRVWRHLKSGDFEILLRKTARRVGL
jgi:hypothetical protein